MQVGTTDSEDEGDTAEDLQRIEAAAAAISQRMQQAPTAEAPEEIQVSFFCKRHRSSNWLAGSTDLW